MRSRPVCRSARSKGETPRKASQTRSTLIFTNFPTSDGPSAVRSVRTFRFPKRSPNKKRSPQALLLRRAGAPIPTPHAPVAQTLPNPVSRPQ